MESLKGWRPKVRERGGWQGSNEISTRQDGGWREDCTATRWLGVFEKGGRKCMFSQ